MNQYKIWYVASEVSPFAKTGGLGDVTGAFPKNLKAKNHEIRVVMPKYKSINERKYVLREVIRLKDIPVTINGETKTINVKSAFLPDSKVQIYFVEIPEFFGRAGLYTDQNTGKDYDDNAQRYAFFCKGVLETLKILSWRPDIIHCNDWQTGLVPIYLNSIYKNDEFLQGIKTIFTIHNFAYQGVFDKSLAKEIDIESQEDNVTHNDKINLMKGAINNSDWITTVSKSYADEISNKKEFGYGLETQLKSKGVKFSGILNGVDYGVWSPNVDKYIPFKYSDEDMEGKEKNKQALLTRVNLPYQENVPVIGMISRIVEQKGYKLLLDALDELIEQDFQLVVLGTGDPELEKSLLKKEKKYSKKISLNTAFDETLAHMIEAGSDMFLMPSEFEPCGMNQLYSLKYGTLPIVFKTGGLADTITELDLEENSGNGIVFEKFTAKELVKSVKRALRYYKKKEVWSELRQRIMHEDYSWEKSTDEYLEIYDTVLNE
jgi:starch synthase